MMITINGEPFSVYLKVENEILHLRDVKREQAEQITALNQDWERMHNASEEYLKIIKRYKERNEL